MRGTDRDIPGLKRNEELEESLEGLDNISFADLFDLNDIQKLQNEFSEATGVASIITTPDGTPITAPSNFCRLCQDIIRQTEKGRINCQNSDAALGVYKCGGPTVRPCMSGGLWDAGAGITVGGRHIANWLIGQVRDETQTEFKMRKYASEIGANVERTMKAFREVPAMSRERFDKIAQVLFTLAQQLSTTAYKNLQLAKYIAERKQAEDELNRYKGHLEETVRQRTTELVEARDQAENANRSKSIFLANMSHELRTPLNAVLGFSSLMRGDITISDSHRKTLDIINRSGEHLLNLINDVLDVARIEAGKVELAPSACDLGEMMRDITDMIHQRAEEKGLQLIFDQTSNFPRFVSIDGGKLRQVLINLINNAVKYTEHGMVSFRIDATDRTDARTTTLTFEIRDTGPGISIEDQKHVFEPFVQVGDPQARKGTGLGLTITRQYIELMGGTISLDSVLGEGSCFSVTIPVELSTESEIVQASGRLGRVTGLEEGQPEYRILIVDDQPENSLLLRCLLEPIGLKVRIAENGSKAVHIFDEWRPHFIWMDRQMPVMDGLDATKAIRKLPGGGDTIIVCLTASAFMEQRKESLMAGMDDFMSKPYHADEIYDSMAKHLGLKYIYDEEKKAPQISSKELGSIPASALDTLSEDLLSRLSSAILTLDTAMIGGVITEISEQDSTAGELLTTHMERLSYTTILQALDERSKRVIPGKKAA